MEAAELRKLGIDVGPARCQPNWVRTLHWVGAPIHEQWCTGRDAFVLLAQVFRQILRWPWRWKEISGAIVQIGVGSIPIIAVATAFAGLVITNEIAWHMDEALHTVTMVPGFTSQFILRELGIAIPALLLVSKVGAAMTAEVGTMRVTEQLDALELLGIDRIAYLVFPRWIACIFSLTCLTMVAIAVTLACAVGVAVVRFNFSFLEYVGSLRHFVEIQDVVCAIVKASVFGAAIPVVCCAYGFRCRGGAEGVGTATTNAVVTSTLVVIGLDFVLTYTFTLIF